MIKIIFLISKIILNVAEILKVILEILQNMNLFWKEQAPIQPSFKPLSKSGSHDADVRHFRYWPISEVSSRVRIFEFDFVHYCAEDQSSDLRHGLGFPHVRSTYQSICRMRADTFRLKKEGWIGEKQWNNKEILWYERRIFTGKSDLDSHSFFSLTQIFFQKTSDEFKTYFERDRNWAREFRKRRIGNDEIEIDIFNFEIDFNVRRDRKSDRRNDKINLGKYVLRGKPRRKGFRTWTRSLIWKALRFTAKKGSFQTHPVKERTANPENARLGKCKKFQDKSKWGKMRKESGKFNWRKMPEHPAPLDLSGEYRPLHT